MQDQKYIIFLMDDDQDDLEILSGALESANCASSIQHFTSSSTLLQTLRVTHPSLLPDLIVLDYWASFSNKLQVVEELRNNPDWLHIALIVYSDIIPAAQLEALELSGVDSFVTKAYNLNHTKAHVEQFCAVVAKKQSEKNKRRFDQNPKPQPGAG